MLICRKRGRQLLSCSGPYDAIIYEDLIVLTTFKLVRFILLVLYYEIRVFLQACGISLNIFHGMSNFFEHFFIEW